MSEPVKELIVQDVVDAINAITTANGFQQTLVAQRPIRGNMDAEKNAQNGTVLVIQGDEEENDAYSPEGNPKGQGWTMPIYLEVFIVAEHGDTTTPLDKLANRAEADIIKKLSEDRHRGGHAQDTLFTPTERRTDGPDATGLLMRIDTIYATSEQDPYTER